MPGRWYGDDIWYGLHYDLHANPNDTDLGAHDDPRELAATLRLMNPQWVQTDCKGGAGLTSWRSQVKSASVAPGLVGDALRTWRDATRQLGTPLHAHYMSLWDGAAWEQHSEWRADLRLVDGETKRLCPRSGYVDELVIPQMLEAIEMYGVDGFWVDGESWAFQFCYCDACTKAYFEATGNKPTVDVNDPSWPAWVNFQHDSVVAFTNHYIEAVHAVYPEVLFTCDYAGSLRDPGEPRLKTDWLSSDVWRDLDDVRQEARFMSTRDMPWDVMIWAFDRQPFLRADHSKPNPYNWRTLGELQRQGVQTICQNGNLQVYENPSPLRDARLVPWRMGLLGQLGEFLAPRRAMVVGSDPVRQAVVLNSEVHLRSQPVKDLFSYDISPLRGALYNLLDQSLCTDILDEWALIPIIDQYQLVVVPEQVRLSDAMADALRAYVRYGGRLLVSGAGMVERLGADFLGVEAYGQVDDKVYYLAAGGQSIAVWSASWRHVKATTARTLSPLLESPLLDDRATPYAAATVQGYGAGKVAYVPGDLFKLYDSDRRPMLRSVVGEIISALAPRLDVVVDAPASIDVVLRKKEGALQIHLLNKVEQPSGAVAVRLRMPQPAEVECAFEKAGIHWCWDAGELAIELERVAVHLALVITPQCCCEGGYGH